MRDLLQQAVIVSRNVGTTISVSFKGRQSECVCVPYGTMGTEPQPHTQAHYKNGLLTFIPN